MVVLTENLPESSSQVREDLHDVFLSFRGADTRNSFTDHLYEALREAGYNMFLDDSDIESGEPLKQELESAIKSSRASIIVLSKNYASSSWCLDELVLILDQKRNHNQFVIPIFYHVEPADVAMAKHKKWVDAEADTKKKISQRAQNTELWKRALREVAGLNGKSASDRKETELIEEVVTEIQHRLGVPIRNTLPLIIGMDDDIESISSWLNDGSWHTANILTVVGKGGIGKTSLAKYVFGLHSRKFHKSSFIEGINTRCNQHFDGLLDLQKQLYRDISKETSFQVNDVAVCTSMIEEALACKMVFIVLDDIGSPDQLDALLGGKGIHPGSKIITTTTDVSSTERCALFNLKVQPRHTQVCLNGISKAKSLELLCIHAFKCNDFIKEGYEIVSKELVQYCKGHPLALEVLGRSLHKQDVAYWEDCTKVLKKEPHFCINRALKMSFESLPFENDKDLFKYIACFFVGTDRDVTETILNACDINTISGITNLIDRCLLSIGRTNKLMMHQLAQEMGRDLVRQESPNKPWKRSRLWHHVESFDVLKQNKGTKNVLGLALDMRMLEKEEFSGLLPLETDALSKMDNLKLLQLNYVKISGSYKNISKDLRWLCMHGFHLKSIPPELPMENLVVLDMSHSNIETFDMSHSNIETFDVFNSSSQQFVCKLKGSTDSNSKGKRLLGSLKILDLSFCEHLHSIGGFFELPALERLIISNCTSLIQVSDSIRHCVELIFIDLSNCKKLRKLPRTIGKSMKLETLSLNGCDLAVFPTELKRMNSIQALMADKKGINLQIFYPISMQFILRNMRSLMSYTPRTSLVYLSLINCNLSNESFPMGFSSLLKLKRLNLDGNSIVSLPSCVGSLPSLEILSIKNCAMLETIAYPPPTLKVLSLTSSYLESKSMNYPHQILFNSEMSLLNLKLHLQFPGCSSVEIEGMVKIQSMADVEEKILHSLGWTYLGSIQYQQRKTEHLVRGALESHYQMYYEFGIFSTFYWGKEIPNWISHSSKGSSISFTIPSSPKKLRGLNVCSLLKFQVLNECFSMPLTVVSNITKNLTWIYKHYIPLVDASEECALYISHWMFGKNEMEDGDQLTITIAKKNADYYVEATECGVSLVYDDDGDIEEEEDVLGYYKSWNHIIGGDLSPFQLTTGEYILHNSNFLNGHRKVDVSHYLPFVAFGDMYKESTVRFKPFSQLKSAELGGASEVPTTTEYVFMMEPLNKS